ncbi:GFA family protein [Pseudoroseicyclus tamaricis]|uniref:GFA family protein n=2 Tax=Pseudoroseicyclus tamaricis TaxID=2705421 RepID=A0A6B2K2T4_9RHOB|nr:GFA family protein [Pseudoroseicyclus tamaricis]NDV00786.1 GFA family protein [Pseudoroseicyclus tamaricis]
MGEAPALEGRCICGGAGWWLAERPQDATTCNCTFCRRFGVMMAYAEDGPGGTITGETRLYLWGPRAIALHLCPTCGSYLGWTEVARGGPRRFAANLRLALDPDSVADIPVQPFEGLVSFEDLPKRGQCLADLWA